MTKEELKALGDKIADGTATEEERLQFLTEVNSLVSGIHSDLVEVNK